MKKLLCLLCATVLLLSLCSCRTQSDSIETNPSKDSVKEFMELLQKDHELFHSLRGFLDDGKHCYNVTPASVASETDMNIFKFSQSSASFVMLEQEIYPLCDFFGGHGFVNAVPCDFDNDGNKDLLVASSWGSGMHRSIISIFNSVTKESTILFNTFDSDVHPNDMDLAVIRAIPVLSSKKPEDTPFSYYVVSVEIETNPRNYADLSYTTSDIIGSIEICDAAPKFISFPSKKD